VQDPIDIAHHFIVPEPQNLIIMVHEPLCAWRITFARRMLAAIDLDDEPSFPTNKVYDEWSNRFLAHELEPLKSAGPQPIPKKQISVSRISTKPPPLTGLDLFGTAHFGTSPSPGSLKRSDLSPQAGRGKSKPIINGISPTHP
jgi:hypothetical protein